MKKALYLYQTCLWHHFEIYLGHKSLIMGSTYISAIITFYFVKHCHLSVKCCYYTRLISVFP